MPCSSELSRRSLRIMQCQSCRRTFWIAAHGILVRFGHVTAPLKTTAVGRPHAGVMLIQLGPIGLFLGLAGGCAATFVMKCCRHLKMALCLHCGSLMFQRMKTYSTSPPGKREGLSNGANMIFLGLLTSILCWQQSLGLGNALDVATLQATPAGTRTVCPGHFSLHTMLWTLKRPSIILMRSKTNRKRARCRHRSCTVASFLLPVWR
mmetsp:Transcript_20143/g.39333  ORF Transcript_20143/g.39333 Transcript_20143/m.39333 type:complete len:207 (-) Transcript_20143:64-684(-)